ncbi:MAG: hypothetical protein C4B59_11925 [Candidatus Methanogaster sp.]|uniref:Uncharacterized protein n=1 Tax=Candidatus Methanogaster sp. TaxID=3386292 RepID=A0AC61L0L5_9EURY|nr:MAG: hypothetical protein C4B59_11925 [ANME-2 cluster archaeon]
MKIPKPLLDDITMGKCLPFIGAGFSLNCSAPAGLKMPDWSGLSETWANEADIDPKLSPPKIASLYERRFGRVQLIESIRRSLHIDKIEPGEVHCNFASLPFETVYTTNFDLLLEAAYQEIKKPFRSLVGECQMPFHGGPLIANIVKMHGDLRHEEHIIVTEEDFNRYLEDYPIIATHLSAMLITMTGLFLGYSLSDPNFQHIKEVVRSRISKFERMAYIVQFDASPSDIEEMLQLNLHIINLTTSGRKSRDDALIEFFQGIQTYTETHEAIRIRELRPEAFEPLEKDTLLKSFKVEDSASLLASSSNLCFVIMSFRSEYDLVYHQLIKPAAETSGLKVLRANDIYSPGVLTEQIKAAIHQSRICIAEVTNNNPNALYEVGIAHTLSKPTILLSQSVEQIPFDLRSLRFIIYDMKKPDRAKENIEGTIKEILGKGKLAKAEELLQQDNARASISETSVYLEQSLRELVYRNKDKISHLLQGRSPERLVMDKMLEYLSRLGVFSKKDVPKIQKCIALRNKTVHHLAEPTIADAKLFIEVVSYFVQKYLGGDFAGR